MESVARLVRKRPSAVGCTCVTRYLPAFVFTTTATLSASARFMKVRLAFESGHSQSDQGKSLCQQIANGSLSPGMPPPPALSCGPEQATMNTATARNGNDAVREDMVLLRNVRRDVGLPVGCTNDLRHPAL